MDMRLRIGVSNFDDVQQRRVPFGNELLKRPVADFFVDATDQLIREGVGQARRTEIIPPSLHGRTEMGKLLRQPRRTSRKME